MTEILRDGGLIYRSSAGVIRDDGAANECCCDSAVSCCLPDSTCVNDLTADECLKAGGTVVPDCTQPCEACDCDIDPNNPNSVPCDDSCPCCNSYITNFNGGTIDVFCNGDLVVSWPIPANVLTIQPPAPPKETCIYSAQVSPFPVCFPDPCSGQPIPRDIVVGEDAPPRTGVTAAVFTSFGVECFWRMQYFFFVSIRNNLSNPCGQGPTFGGTGIKLFGAPGEPGCTSSIQFSGNCPQDGTYNLAQCIDLPNIGDFSVVANVTQVTLMGVQC